MNYSKIKAISVTGVLFTCMVHATCFASDSWTGFVPPTNSKMVVPTETLFKSKWRSGINFNTHNQFKFIMESNNDIQAKNYELTEPQRKSVNPWNVQQTHKKHYSFEPYKRPWGSVPARFQGVKNGNGMTTGGMHNSNVTNRPSYDPYMNHKVFVNASPLLPIGGYFPIYTNPGYNIMNPFIRNNHGFISTFPWR